MAVAGSSCCYFQLPLSFLMSAMELSEEITCKKIKASCPTNILPKYYIIRYKQQKLLVAKNPASLTSFPKTHNFTRLIFSSLSIRALE